MRWRSCYALQSQVGNLRVVRRFLWWPRTFNSTRTRWLETAWIVEQVRAHCFGMMEGGGVYWRWDEIGFADEPDSSDIRLRPDGHANGWWGQRGEFTPIYDIHVTPLGAGFQVLSLESAILRELPVISWSDPRCPVAPFRRPAIPKPETSAS